MSKRLTSILVCCAFFACYFLFFNKTQITNYPPKEGPIVAFGDSLVAGVVSPETEGFIKPLSAMIGEPIINLGVSGNTTGDGLARIENVIAEKPRIVILLLGGNDRLRQKSIDETIQNLRTIVITLQDSGAVVVLLAVKGNVLSNRFADEVETLAEETGSAFVPNVLDGVFGNKELMFDEIHPNKAGYQIIAQKVNPVLNGVMK